MEPESTSSQQPINQPAQQPPEPAGEAPQPAQPATEPVMTPEIQPEPSAQPEAPEQPVSSPVAQAEIPVAPIPSAPIVSSPGAGAPASEPSGSHATLIIGALLASLLAGGAGAYYYWMNTTATPVAIQATDVATSTESMKLSASDPTLRPTLEQVIKNMNAALAEGNYENFIKTMAATSSAEIKKEDFDQAKDLFKGLMTIDLAKVSFVDAKQDSVFAGYYFTATGTPDNKTPPVLSLVKFVKEGEQWKIGKLYSKNISASDDITAIITTDPAFSFSMAATTTASSTAQ